MVPFCSELVRTVNEQMGWHTPGGAIRLAIGGRVLQALQRRGLFGLAATRAAGAGAGASGRDRTRPAGYPDRARRGGAVERVGGQAPLPQAGPHAPLLRSTGGTTCRDRLIGSERRASRESLHLIVRNTR